MIFVGETFRLKSGFFGQGIIRKTSRLGVNGYSSETMSCFEHALHYSGKDLNNSGSLCCRPDEYRSFDNQRLEGILSQSKCFSKTRENWSTRIYEAKTPKLSANSIVFPAMAKSSIIKSPASISCSSIKINRRKQTKPCKSASKDDPNFRGVSFSLQTKIINGNSELKITPLLKNYKLRKRIPRCRRHSYDTDSASGSDLDNSPKKNSKQARIESFESLLKVCNSCGTRKTPLWRDAEDGTPLCNACGIRYKKYRLRCSRCWYIPKRDDKTYSKCIRCNAMVCWKDRNRTLKDYF